MPFGRAVCVVHQTARPAITLRAATTVWHGSKKPTQTGPGYGNSLSTSVATTSSRLSASQTTGTDKISCGEPGLRKTGLQLLMPQQLAEGAVERMRARCSLGNAEPAGRVCRRDGKSGENAG